MSIPYNNEITMGLDNLKKGVYVFIVTTKKTSNSKQVYSRLVNYYY
jgi:hypothetical protein